MSCWRRISTLWAALMLGSALAGPVASPAAAPAAPPAPATTTWIGSYGGSGDDQAKSVIATADGGYAIAGYTGSFGAGGCDAWVLKLAADGHTQWQKIYGGTNCDIANRLVATPDGGYGVAGYTYSFGAGRYDAWVLKLDADGTVQWQQTYGGGYDDYAYSLALTGDGSYAVAGYTYSFDAGRYDPWVLKLDTAGNVQWQKQYIGGDRSYYPVRVVATTDGGFAIAGYSEQFGFGLRDAWALKLDGDGNVQWQRAYGSSDDDWVVSLVATPDGGYAVAGYTQSFGLNDAWVLKLGADGRVQWQKAYGTSFGDFASSLVATADGGYAVAGGTYLASGHNDAWVFKLDALGNVKWQKTYGAYYDDYAYDLVATPDGGYAVAGYASREYDLGPSDLLVMKLDAEGNAGDACPVIGTSTATVTEAPGSTVETVASAMDWPATAAASSATVSDTTATLQCFVTRLVHIGGIQASYRPLPSGYQVGALVWVQDDSGQPVLGATVSLAVRLPDGTRRFAVVDTNTRGLGRLALTTQQTGTYWFCVVLITGPNYIYDPAHNVQTCASVTVP